MLSNCICRFVSWFSLIEFSKQLFPASKTCDCCSFFFSADFSDCLVAGLSFAGML